MRHCHEITGRFCCALACALIVLSAQALYARGQGALMGQLQTVVEMGPLDAGRNPALLTLLGQASTGSVFVLGRAYERYDVSSDNESFEADFSAPVSATVIAAYAGRIGRAVVGIELGDNGSDALYLNREFEMGFAIKSAMVSQETEVTSWNPVCRLALALPLSGADSIGIQVNTGYSRIMTDSVITINSGATNIRAGQNSTDRVVTASALAGYLHAEGDSQLGLVVSSGEIRWQWTDLSVDEELIGTGPTGSASFSASNRAKYVAGPAILAGAYRRFTPMLSAAFECGYMVPASYTQTRFKYVGGSSLAEEQTVRVDDDATYVFRAGVSLTASPGLVFSAGATYIDITRNRLEEGVPSDDGDERKEEKIHILLATMGLDYSPGERLTFTLGTFVTRSAAESDQNGSDSALSTDATVIAVDIAAGVTWRF